MDRKRAARYFNPLHIKGHPATAADITALACFRSMQHPEVKPLYEKMATEVSRYNQLVQDIKPAEERMRVKHLRSGKEKREDTFDIRQWWLASKNKLPATFEVLRAVLCNSPNAAPPDRLFSVMNDTFTSDQKRAYSDYISLSLKLQFNNRTR